MPWWVWAAVVAFLVVMVAAQVIDSIAVSQLFDRLREVCAHYPARC